MSSPVAYDTHGEEITPLRPIQFREEAAPMNVLIYDAPKSVCHLVKSLLLTQRHRAAISTDAVDAILKLETGLFDILIFGPEGAPAELADHVEREFPALPVVLAGVPVNVPCIGQVVAVLPAPISAQRLVNAFIRIDRWRTQRLREIPCQIAAQEGLSVACRLADLSPEHVVLAGESDDFTRHFGGTLPARIEARVGDTVFSAEVGGDHNDPVARVRKVSLRTDAETVRPLLLRLLKA
jgi:hypothetical protein